MPPLDYSRAYESAKKELAELVSTQDRISKRIVVLRESLKMLEALCQSEEVEIEPSAEADYIRLHSTLAQDIQAILKAEYPSPMRPSQVREKLERLGHNLSEYKNPQAMIHMALKRMAQSREIEETTSHDDGKQVYRCAGLAASIAESMLKINGPLQADIIAKGLTVKAANAFSARYKIGEMPSPKNRLYPPGGAKK